MSSCAFPAASRFTCKSDSRCQAADVRQWIHRARASIRTTAAERGSCLSMRAVMRHAVRPAASKGVMSKRSASRSSDREVMQHLSRSQIFKDYERAFSEAMGLPLNIRGHDSWSPAHHGKEDRNSLASILARFNKARAACLRAQTDASREPD